jgi:carbonic anhydrase
MANIIPNNNAICDLKCKYTFNYIDSDADILNFFYSINIYLSFKENSKDTVTYNSNTYNTRNFILIYPSMNKYNGKQADAELLIFHQSKIAGYLLVCIPILISNETTQSSKILGEIIDKAYTNSLIKNYKDINNRLSNKINLNDLIPMKKYYTDKFKFSYDTKAEHNIIVFSIDDKAYITMKQQHYDKLIKTINKSNNLFDKIILFTNSIYSNINGPSIPNNNEEDIYIDCKPYTEEDIDDNGENNPPSKLSSDSNIPPPSSSNITKPISSSNFFNSKQFKIAIIVIFCLLIIIVFFMLLYKFLNSTKNITSTSTVIDIDNS